MQFNNDGGSNYGTKRSSNGAADSITSAANFLTELAGAVSTDAQMTWIEMFNVSSIRKQGHINGGSVSNATNVAGQTCHGNVVWNNTSDQITSCTIFFDGLLAM